MVRTSLQHQGRWPCHGMFQMWRHAMPVVVHKDVPLGLVSINKMPEDGQGTKASHCGIQSTL
jgi:hypothetical protein